jgi:hypothetical protein
MIARLHILLPYAFSIRADQGFPTYDLEVEGETARVYPPYKAQVDRSALEVDSPLELSALGAQLQPADPQPTTPFVLLDGSETVQADALQVDFIREVFERRRGTDDPPVELGFRVANDLLARLRTLGRAGQVKPVSPTSIVWRLAYLNDDESELEPTETLHRARGGVSWQWKMFGLHSDLWEAARVLPADFKPSAWDTLLLDALDLLPEIGPPIVLSFAAIETRIESALDDLAPQAGLSDELWGWITTREDDYRKEPSITEKVDALLHAVSGHSLKEDTRLWQAFQNLRKARNTFVHEGRAMIGNEAVTPQRVSELVALSGDIIEWIEGLLPEAKRRARYEREDEHFLQLTKMLVTPAPPEEAAEQPGPEEESREEL